jgi:catechol 2,3-dioxygenase-like lactoylglutathione lyase family enzyme
MGGGRMGGEQPGAGAGPTGVGSLGIRGVNHLALVCADMARTVAFYQGVLGLPLVKTIELPGGMGQHFFFDLGNGDSLAFFWFPDGPPAAPGVAAPAALPGLGDLRSAVASMNHLAFDVPPEHLEEACQRLQAAGVAVVGPVNHDDSEAGWSPEPHPGVFMRSVYFADPDGICLELAAWLRRPGPGDVRHEPRGRPVSAGPARPEGFPTGR